MTELGEGRHVTEELDESVLVERVLAGDQQAYGILVRRHERLVFRIVGGFLRNA